MRRVAIMTGGGDCAGINSFIAGAVRHGISKHGLEFVGVKKAFSGMVGEDVQANLVPLTKDRVDGLEAQPSTVLGSSRFNPFSKTNVEKGVPDQIVANLESLSIDAVLVTGGNDTINTASGLSKRGIPVVAAPKSIDNDVSGTDIMLGFATACQFGATAFRSTAESASTHGRISVVEIMGRDAGWLTLEIGAAGGADIILIPEFTVELGVLCGRVERMYRDLPGVSLAVAEGVNISASDPVLARARDKDPVVRALMGDKPVLDVHGNQKLGGISMILARILYLELGLGSPEEVRRCDLGFHLRGLPPVSQDVVLGLRLGVGAVERLASGEGGVMVGLQGTEVVSVPFEQALIYRRVDWPRAQLESFGVLICDQSSTVSRRDI